MCFYKDVRDASPALIQRAISDRQRLMRCETEDFLRSECLKCSEQRDRFWSRDYGSVEKYLESVKPNRQRFREAIGVWEAFEGEFDCTEEPFMEADSYCAGWINVRCADNLRARAVLALPSKPTGAVPLVIAQHGISSSPERVFGFDDDSDIYHSYGQRLAEAGYAILTPAHITMAKPRERLSRLCEMLDASLWGLEIAKLSRLLDYMETRPEVDTSRTAMWGISLGGAYTSFALPVEQRISVGINTAWFNHRIRKMAFDDPRYSCFLSVDEAHIFWRGWLREFSDSDLTSLICPRPYQIQTGKADGISWWPYVLEEFEETRAHYEKLGLGDRIDLHLHETGHEIRCEAGLSFLKKWL